MRKVNVAGISLAVEDVGVGTPLVCLHGFPLSHRMWREQTAELSSVCRFIAPDLRGFGQSNVTNGVVTMEQMADDVAGLLDALGVQEPVVLCGLSMGGYVAWPFARKYPERLKGLILCDTRAIADTPEAATNRQRLAKLVQENGPEVVATAMLPNLLSSQTLTSRPEIATFLRELILGTSRDGIAAALLGMAERPNVRDWLRDCHIPSLLVVGVDDKISTVTEMREIADAMPNARLVVIENAGHMAPLENPAPVNAAIRDFLMTL